MRTIVVNDTTLEFVDTGSFDTRVHPCTGCWFHEQGLKCDDFIGAQSMGESDFDCGVTKVFKEVK